MNVLLTCGGRRNYLVDYFRRALAGKGRVVVTDASSAAPALAAADCAFTVPPITDDSYIGILENICRSNEIGLIVPLNDLELPLLSSHRGRFEALGAKVAVSGPDVIDTCFDKLKTYQFLSSFDIATPFTVASLEEADAAIASGELGFPLIIKPRWGSASIGIEVVEDAEELRSVYPLVQRRVKRSILAGVSRQDPERAVLIQQRLSGSEHGLDVVNDFSGRHVATFARRKLAMRAGETDRATTVHDPALTTVGRRLGSALGHVANLDCDVFTSGDDIHVLEMNPRFGGGYPFSHAAGADIPATLVAWARGEEPDPRWLTIDPGVVSAKCDIVISTARRAPSSPIAAGR
jgi:carbamoyl-phosphate synthase large subunit